MPEGLERQDPAFDTPHQAFDAMLRQVINHAERHESMDLASVLAELDAEIDAAIG